MAYKNVEDRRANEKKNYPAKYARRKQEIRDCINARRKLIWEWFLEYRKQFACAACGKREGIQFHHNNPADKRCSVATMARSGYSILAILAEIEKCTPFCEDCHKEDPHDGGYFRGQPQKTEASTPQKVEVSAWVGGQDSTRLT